MEEENNAAALQSKDTEKLLLLWQIISDNAQHESAYDLALRVRRHIELFADYPAFCRYIEALIEENAVIISGGAQDFEQAVA